MALNITEAIRRIKQDLARLIEPQAIIELCRAVGHKWRERVLDPVTTIHRFILQILHGNTACAHLPHLAKRGFTASAYCQGRARLPLELFERLLDRGCAALQPMARDTGRWRGHRTFWLDGSGFSMRDTPELQKEFGQPSAQKPGCGFPVAHMLTLFHAGSGLLLKVLTAPLRTHDMSRAAVMHPELAADDVLMADRGLCSFAHLALLFLRNLHAVLRVHQNQIVDFTSLRPHVASGKDPLRRGVPRSRWLYCFGANDQLVEWFKSENLPKWMTAEQYAALPPSLVLRELRYRVGRPGFRTQELTLVTTLVDPERYPAQALADLYGTRWQVETNLSHLKRTMQMAVLRCETVAGVKKELTIFALVYNLVRLVMLEASRRQQVEVDRISFVDALRWLSTAQAREPLPELIINPARPNRIEPRVRKRRAKEYPLMQKPRSELRKELRAEPIGA